MTPAIRVRMSIVFACALLGSNVVAAQHSSLWTVVHYPMDERVSVQLVSPSPVGGGGKADTIEPGGNARVTRDDEHTTIDVSVSGLPAGTYFLYTIDAQNRARKLATLTSPYKKVHQLLASDDTFMIVVSKDDNLSSLPARDRIVLYSAVPRGLPVVGRQ